MPESKNAAPGTCCEDKKLTSQKSKKSAKADKLNPESKNGKNGKAKAKCESKADKSSKKCATKAGKKSAENSKTRTTGDNPKDPETMSEETKSRRMHRLAMRKKRAEEQLKMMFQASVDPFERPLRWWEQPHVKYAFSHSAVKSRLEALMGSNIVRLTDRKYMLTLIMKIREDHENQQAARIKERKTRELMRTKTMILNRFMSIEEAQPEILQYPLFQLYLYCDSISHRPRKKLLPPKKVKISNSLYRMLYPERLILEVQPTENISLSEATEEGEEETGSLSEEEMEEKPVRKKRADEPINEYMFSRDEYDNLHYEADAVKKLKDIKTVNAMYAKAHDIVGNLFSLTGGTKRKNCEREKVKEVKETKEV